MEPAGCEVSERQPSPNGALRRQVCVGVQKISVPLLHGTWSGAIAILGICSAVQHSATMRG